MKAGSLEKTQAIAHSLADLLKPGMVISLVGHLGSGKTTFTQSLGKALGVSRLIKSPTYNIVKEYNFPGGTLLHIDAYRLEDIGGDSIDLPSLMQDDTITVIEWAEYIIEDLPESYLEISFTVLEDESRSIDLSVVGQQGKYIDIINQMNQTFD